MRIINNTEMNAAQKAKAFEVLGGYISGKQVKEVIVSKHDELNGQILLETELNNSLKLQTIIGTRGKVIAHGFN